MKVWPKKLCDNHPQATKIKTKTKQNISLHHKAQLMEVCMFYMVHLLQVIKGIASYKSVNRAVVILVMGTIVKTSINNAGKKKT